MNPHLQTFAGQLQSWSQAIIDHGRTPFRRVDCFPRIDTTAGQLQPPLVFWINRQSMMAGGLILLPEQDLAAELQRGRSCASALGLSHFVTWEAQQVRLWEVRGEAIVELRSFALPGVDHPDYFRHLLGDVVDALKVPAVTGAIPQQRLCFHYFNNLFLITQELALTSLTDAFRSRRAEDPAATPVDVDHLAAEANRLLLLQILVALWYDLLPDAVLPEQLAEVLRTSLQRAPQSIRAQLAYSREAAPAALPLETAVCYHHLLLRLHQLNWREPLERRRQSLLGLVELWYPGYRQQQPAAAGLCYPGQPPLGHATRMLIDDSPLLLATTAVVREISGLTQPLTIYGSLFQLDAEHLPQGDLCARLLNREPILRSARQAFGARLRISWPHRSLRIRVEQPYWKWELIHLLGLCHAEQALCLDLPSEALSLPADDPFWAVLLENYRVDRITSKDPACLRLELLRAPQEDQPIHLRLADRTTTLHPPFDPARLIRQIVSTLDLPVSESALAIEPGASEPPEKNLRQQLIDQLTTFGIPSFPDQYLYFLEHPEMVSYRFSPPLTVTAKLLGQFDLLDSAGQTLSGYGEELEQALLICARLGKTRVDLPQDRHHLDIILQRYRKDLAALYRHLGDLSYRRLENSRAARNLIRQIWKKLDLPDPEWFKN